VKGDSQAKLSSSDLGLTLNTLERDAGSNISSLIAPSLNLSPMKSPTSSSISSPSPNLRRVDKAAISLNLLLENVMQMTFRKDAVTPNVRLIRDDKELISSTNLSELICARLYEGMTS
jgi:hypothetical protein